MATPDKRQDRIEAAHRLNGVLSSIGDVKDDARRHALIHDQIAAAVQDICCQTGEKKHFTAGQIEHLTEIGFHIAYVLDPRNQPPKSFAARARKDFRESGLGARLTMVGAAITIIIGLTTIGGFAVRHVGNLADSWSAPLADGASPQR